MNNKQLTDKSREELISTLKTRFEKKHEPASGY